jgi:uncharacterized short protein YbdD (DUF466 family)
MCRCFGHSLDTAEFARRALAVLDVMVGLPDYEAYAAHMARAHPESAALSREAFFRLAEARRYGVGGRLRCC